MRWETIDHYSQPAEPPRPAASLPAARPPRAANTIESRPASERDRSTDAQVLHQVKAAGIAGRTRNELHQMTGISIQTLSWSLGRMLKDGRLFRRIDPAHHDGKLRFVSRDRCYVVYSDLYRDSMATSDAPPFEERRPARRSA